MRIAVLGATSQIARDLIVSCSAEKDLQLYLFARRPEMVTNWLATAELSGRYPVDSFAGFAGKKYDAVINFVGSGDPAKTAALGNSLFEITWQYDQLALDYLRTHPACRYLFLSSGAAYGTGFLQPVRADTPATLAINNVAPGEWYGVAKMHAECRHRASPELAIMDLRVFSYFSHTQDLAARFLMSDILRAIRDSTALKTSPDFVVRDFLHPGDFYQLVLRVLASPPANAAIDAYSRAPIDKPSLLAAMQEKFGLRHETTGAAAPVNATGLKPHYYSLNRRAADFGYQPALTSLEGVLLEAGKIIRRNFN